MSKVIVGHIIRAALQSIQDAIVADGAGSGRKEMEAALWDGCIQNIIIDHAQAAQARRGPLLPCVDKPKRVRKEQPK